VSQFRVYAAFTLEAKDLRSAIVRLAIHLWCRSLGRPSKLLGASGDIEIS